MKAKSATLITIASRQRLAKNASRSSVKDTSPSAESARRMTHTKAWGMCVSGPAMDTFKSSPASPSWPTYANPPSGQRRIWCTCPPTCQVAKQCPSSCTSTVPKSTGPFSSSCMAPYSGSPPLKPYSAVMSM